MNDFPIMQPLGSSDLRSIPWEMLKFPSCEARAQRNHGQTLQRLAERGGLSPFEAVCILKDLDLMERMKRRTPNARMDSAQLSGMVLAWRSFVAGRMEAFDPCI